MDFDEAGLDAAMAELQLWIDPAGMADAVAEGMQLAETLLRAARVVLAHGGSGSRRVADALERRAMVEAGWSAGGQTVH